MTNSSLYVPRPEIENFLDQQLGSDPPEYRLASLLGAVGIGKSTLLRERYKVLHQQSNYLTFWLDFSPNPYNPISDELLPDYLNLANLDQWLLQCQEKAEKQLGQKIVLSPGLANFQDRWKGLIDKLCSFDITPVLFLDGFDSIEDYQQRLEIQEKIVADFLRPACTRVLLARRDEQSLDHGYLRWNEAAVSVNTLTQSQQEEQITRRNKVAHEQIQLWLEEKITLEQLIHQLELTALTDTHHQLQKISDKQPNTTIIPYLSGNPFVNTFLFNKSFLKENVPISYRDLGECLEKLLERAGIPVKTTGRTIIQEIVKKLPESWTANQLKQALDLQIDDHKLTQLLQAGIVSLVPGSSRYKVDEGIYHLMQIYLELVGSTN